MNTNTKFENIPTDDDTFVLRQRTVSINQIDAVHQEWVWDGILAESMIFSSADVSHLNAREVLEMVSTFGEVQKFRQANFSNRNDDFVCVNYNFINL